MRRKRLHGSRRHDFANHVRAGSQRQQLVSSRFVHQQRVGIVALRHHAGLQPIQLAVVVQVRVDRHIRQAGFARFAFAVAVQVLELDAPDATGLEVSEAPGGRVAGGHGHEVVRQPIRLKGIDAAPVERRVVAAAGGDGYRPIVQPARHFFRLVLNDQRPDAVGVFAVQAAQRLPCGAKSPV